MPFTVLEGVAGATGVTELYGTLVGCAATDGGARRGFLDLTKATNISQYSSIALPQRSLQEARR